MAEPARAAPGPPARRGRLIAVLLVLFFLVSISTIVRFYTDLLWYREVGLDSVFWTILGSKVLLGVVFGLGFFVFTLANLLIVTRIMPAYRRPVDPDDPIERYRGAVFPYLRWAAIGISALLGLLFSVSVTPNWERIVLALNQVPFDRSDPVFGRDLSFFVFRLPFYEFLYGWLFSGLIVVILLVAAAHYLTGGIRPQTPGDRVTPQVKAHLSALIGLGVLLRAWGYRLDQFRLLFSERGEVTGASYTDVNAEMPALTLLIVISVIVAALFLVNIRRRGWALPLAGAGLWLVIAILAKGLFPFIIERFTVIPAQLEKERPFIERNIESTSVAYGLDEIEVREHPAIEGVSREAIAGNPDTIQNIRLWDTDTLTQAYRQLQEIRTYYEFEDVDVDRYMLDDGLRQVMLSVRELNPLNLETRTWQNLHLVFTHGYGVVVSPTNASTREGEPTFMMKDVPPTTEIDEFRLEQPGIYYGEGFTDIPFVLVDTRSEELDYGSEAGTRNTTYTGEGGVPVSGMLRRLAFAWRFRDVNLVVSSLITPDTKVLFYRHIRERLQLAAPFLDFDGDPYPVIVDGRVVWMADAYTVSDKFPYSERVDFSQRTVQRPIGATAEASITGRNNYIRNSVKATIDAYDGTIRFYVWDPEDPIIRAWRDVFPELFLDADEMPDEIRAHVRYPEDLFRVQTFLYRRYHMTDPREFFTREDQWVIPREPNGEGDTETVLGEIQPYYVLMRLPGSERLEYVLILPMNPIRRPNMISYLAAKSDPDQYGELLDFRFPRGRQIDGVGQVHARINQDPAISEQRTLLSQVGSRLLFGNLLVLPIGESILYIQPLFIQAEESPIPELNSVVLATSQTIAFGRTLEETLQILVAGGGVSEEALPVPGEPSELNREALEHLQAAEAAARRGDWAEFGRRLEELRQVLEQGEQEEPTPSPSP